MDRHFCTLNTGLYHIDTSQWCVTALFFKDNNKIRNQCRLALFNTTGPQAHYLDQGLWLSLLKHLYLWKSSAKITAMLKLSLSSTCNQCVAYSLLLLNSHLTSNNILQASMSHWSLQTSIFPSLHHLALEFGHILTCPMWLSLKLRI